MESKNITSFVAPERLVSEWQVSRSTLWRLEQEGHLRPHYLHSRKLYKLDDVRRVESMIERGALRVKLRGAAARSNSRSNQVNGTDRSLKGGRP